MITLTQVSLATWIPYGINACLKLKPRVYFLKTTKHWSCVGCLWNIYFLNCNSNYTVRLLEMKIQSAILTQCKDQRSMSGKYLEFRIFSAFEQGDPAWLGTSFRWECSIKPAEYGYMQPLVRNITLIGSSSRHFFLFLSPFLQLCLDLCSLLTHFHNLWNSPFSLLSTTLPSSNAPIQLLSFWCYMVNIKYSLPHFRHLLFSYKGNFNLYCESY